MPDEREVAMVATGDQAAPLPPFHQASKMPCRARFYVELKPGETTFVSWKKLIKDFQKTVAPAPSEVPAGAHPALQARIAPEIIFQKDPLPPPANRFNSVIEKIERIYKGGDDSSDENEALNDYPDDDQYDTEDSFIDDRELNDYFSVDKEKLKHDGFFVNRGKLEKETEADAPPEPPVKKRKRRDVKKLGLDSSDDLQKKHKSATSRVKSIESEKIKDSIKERVDIIQSNKSDAAERPKEHLSALNIAEMVRGVDPSGSLKGNHFKESEVKESVTPNSVKHKSGQKSVQLEDSKDLVAVTSRPQTGNSILSPSLGKEISPARSKSTALEKALQDLERGVAQLCPPSLVLRETEQGKRYRLPQEIKQKLAKVARLAAKQGRLTDELIDRLMSILGHVIRVKTLKKHLKEMIEMGLSAMQEKEGRLQDIKREVTEMVKSRVHSLQAQEVEQDFSSDDFQPMVGSAEKPTSDGRYQWDNATEDKICDLYEKYIEGMDENRGPQIRKLYGELAELWPDGWMDNNGIKHAVQRSLERKKKLSKANNAKADLKKRQRPNPKSIESEADKFPVLDLNLPGTDHPSFDKLKVNPELTPGLQLASSSGMKNHQLMKKAQLKSFNSIEKKRSKVEGNPLLKKKVKRKLEKSVMEAVGRSSHGKMMFEAPYWKMGIHNPVALPAQTQQQGYAMHHKETLPTDNTNRNMTS